MAAQWMERSGLTDPKQVKVAAEMIRTTGRATRILDDLLDLTRSSFGTNIPVEKSKTDMATLCQEIAGELRGINASQMIEVTHQGDPTGLWDAARMGQVLSNLMGNAIQYSEASSAVTVAISGTDPEKVVVTVHNFGPPIPPESQKIIFQSWMRGQEVKVSAEHGTHLGLGLYIARLIVEAHGGEIAVTSEEKAGTTKTAKPARTTAKKSAAPKTARDKPAARAKSRSEDD